jgi:hypothetical protein
MSVIVANGVAEQRKNEQEQPKKSSAKKGDGK